MDAVRFSDLLSQGGKTYVLVRAWVPADGSIRVSARTTGGHPVPAKILAPWGHDERVLVVPALLATIRASVLVRDAAGEAVARGVTTIRPSLAFLSSALRERQCDARTLWHRGIDDAPCGRATFVDLERLYTDGSEVDVLHGSIEFTGIDPAIVSRGFSSTLIDAYGRPVSAKPLVIWRDELIELSDGSALRSIRYSKEIPHAQRSCTLWIKHDDHRVQDGFLSLDAPSLAWHRGLDQGRFWSRPDGDGYHDWYVHHDQPSALDLELARRRAGKDALHVSLLVDLSRASVAGLEETLRTLEDQAHGAWELLGYGGRGAKDCWRWRGPAWGDAMAGDAAGEAAGEAMPASPAEALERAKGELIGVVAAGDTLEPTVLGELAEAALAKDAAMAYCDQDLRAKGDGGHAYFLKGTLKTDFDRDLLYATGGTGRLALVRRDALGDARIAGIAARNCRGLAFELELALAAMEDGRGVAHVAKVLYHRAWEGGEIPASQTAPEVRGAEERDAEAALAAHLTRVGVEARIAPDVEAGGGRTVRYALAGNPLISIVIPNKDCVPFLVRCLTSIAELSTYRNFEIVIVENNSEDPLTFELYDAIGGPRVRIARYEGPFNFSAIANLGAREAKGDILLFLNNDTEVLEPRWLELLAGPLQRPDVGAVGARLLYPDSLLQHGGAIVQAEGPLHIELFTPTTYPAYLALSRYHTHQLTAVTGACLATPRRIFEALGGFDERMPVTANDVQYCVSVREAGLGVVMEPRAVLRHFESLSRGLDFSDRAREIRLVAEIGETMRRWPTLYAKGDPYYDHRYAYHNNFYTLGWSPSLGAVED